MSDAKQNNSIIFALPVTPEMKALMDRKPVIEKDNGSYEQHWGPSPGITLTSKFKLNAEGTAYEATAIPYGYVEMDFTKGLKLKRSLKENHIQRVVARMALPQGADSRANELAIYINDDHPASYNKENFARAFCSVWQVCELDEKTGKIAVARDPDVIRGHEDFWLRVNADMTAKEIAAYLDYFESDQFMQDILKTGYKPHSKTGLAAETAEPAAGPV